MNTVTLDTIIYIFWYNLHVLQLFAYSHTLITLILCYPEHCYFMFLYHNYIDSPKFTT